MKRSPSGTLRYTGKASPTTPSNTMGKGYTKIRCRSCGVWMYVKLKNFFKNAGVCDTCEYTTTR